jgi:hypothetical protein
MKFRKYASIFFDEMAAVSPDFDVFDKGTEFQDLNVAFCGVAVMHPGSKDYSADVAT